MANFNGVYYEMMQGRGRTLSFPANEIESRDVKMHVEKRVFHADTAIFGK